MEIGLVATIYIDNDKTYQQAIETLDCVVSKYPLKLYARVTKLDEKHKDILNRFDKVTKNKQNILAKSWNEGIKQALKDGCEYVIIPNLDIKLYDYTIDNLVDFATSLHKNDL